MPMVRVMTMGYMHSRQVGNSQSSCSARIHASATRAGDAPSYFFAIVFIFSVGLTVLSSFSTIEESIAKREKRFGNSRLRSL